MDIKITMQMEDMVWESISLPNYQLFQVVHKTLKNFHLLFHDQDIMDITTMVDMEHMVAMEGIMLIMPMVMVMDFIVEIVVMVLKSIMLMTKNFPLIKMHTIMDHMEHTVDTTAIMVIMVSERLLLLHLQEQL